MGRHRSAREAMGAPAPAVALALALVACAWLAVVPGAWGDPVAFTDQYTPKCTPIALPPPKGFQRWSSPSTWGGGPVPGVGSNQMANVTIPCGQAVLLDVPQVKLNMLTVRGLLSVLDPPAPAAYDVTACFVLVEGQMVIGSPAQHFKSKIVFTLAPNPNGRRSYSGSFNPPADPENPRGLGHKAFVVMGGYVDLHGMPGGGDTPSWVKLAETAVVGQSYIIVDADVSASWPVGAKIAVASTGFYHEQAEDFRITAVEAHPQGAKVSLDQAFTWMHFGDALGIPDGFGGFVDERAEVALLSRNIVITGVDEPAPYQYEGGHFMVFMTNTAQAIEGVEYHLMGQQGSLGRYNIHIHICGDTRGTFTIRKNAIHDSKQRCVVVHATHNLTIDSNVAYNTSGHCFMVEEGGEQDNLFVNNLGMLTRKVDRLILDGPDPGTTQETDNVASTFWITNLYNSYVGNVAAGSDDTGFWFELRNDIRGMSTQIPNLSGEKPSASQFKLFKDNVAHSNHAIGFRLYPHGVNPRNESNRNSSVSEWQWGPGNGRIEGLLAYKNGDSGLFLHSSRNIYVYNSTFADNRYGVELVDNYNCSIVNSRFVGASQNNLDTIVPAWCASANGPKMCGPIKGCALDLTDPANLRYTGGFSWMEPRVGVLIHHFRIVFDGYGPFNITGNSFSGYDSSCGQPRAALGTGLLGISNDALQWWNSGQFVAKTRLAPGVNPMWYPPATYTLPTSGILYMPNETGHNYAIWDKDGTLSGGQGGYILGTDAFLKPPARVVCRRGNGTNSISCPGTCYRTLHITYMEDGFSSSPSYSTRKRGDYSFVTLRRSDGVSRTTDGNLNDLQVTKSTRHFITTIYAPATYELTISPPTGSPNWVPQQVQIGYRDGGGCNKTVTLVVNQPAQGSYDVTFVDNHWWSPCAGLQLASSVQVSRVCRLASSALQLALVGDVPTYATLVSQASPPPPCSLSSRCGVYPGTDSYLFTNTGAELHPDSPGSMGFNMPLFAPDASWQQGRAMIGYQDSPWDGIATFVKPASPGVVTYYYRKTFQLRQSSCFAGMYLDFYVIQGLVAYLNGIEVFRFNLPNTTLTNTTLAQASFWWPNNALFQYNSTYVDLGASDAGLVEGTNYLAFETHVADGQRAVFFDTRLALNLTSAACRGAHTSTEICDGLDNDDDGRVDGNSTDARLVRACATACGVGVESCVNGAYQGCTAPAPQVETCNGKDEDCDGVADNGATCPGSGVCIAGACKTPGPSESTLLVDFWQPWKVLDASIPMEPPASWMTTNFDDSAWLDKRAMLGNRRDPQGTIAMQRPRFAYYFRKTFSVPDGPCYFGLNASFYALDGAVFYVNGAEVYRFQMDPRITTLTASTPSGDQFPASDHGSFNQTGQWLRKGANVVAVEMHIAAKNTGNFYFDIQLNGLKEAACS